ncbi:protein fantom [Conger conger]|uniref:protein fantom n=1 Tax=Conger conger TaxID=82655 RepID=UPI002A5B08D5|nr:protein fantom [Conger conger]
MSTAADETATDVPVKDISLNLAGFGGLQEPSSAQNARERQTVSRISREDLEDRFLRLHEENLLLKQHTHKQEDKIKRMATKLIRLLKDRKREEQAGARAAAAAGVRDVELEEMVEELQERVRELEKHNEGLRQRLLAARQQLLVQGRRGAPYGHVQSRINTGLRRVRESSPAPAHSSHGKGSRSVELDGRPPQSQQPRYGHSLLDEARAEIRNLENVIESQRGQMDDMDRGVVMLQEELKQKEKESEELLLQLREQQTSGQRLTIKDNVEMIKLQKQLAEKGNACTVLEGRYVQLQENQKSLKASHNALMAKVEEQGSQLKEERLRSLGLEKQVQSSSLAQRRVEELQERIQDLEKEKELLKENCDKLFNSAFDVTQEQRWKTREQQLKLQVANLEVALKSDLTDKNEILDKIKVERELNEKLSQQNGDLQLRFLEQKQQLDEIKDRMKFFTKESDIDMAELSEALMLIKVRNTQKNKDLGFLEKAEAEVQRDLDRTLRELQATQAETVQELEKTRNMLIMQHKINKDYQTEVEAVTRKMEDIKVEYELKLESLAQLLDMRAARIRKLEAQLKDIAYGTKSHVFRAEVTEQDVADEFDETVHLERGENLLEIHVAKAGLTPAALRALGDPEPSTFCTFAFYDFQLQATPVVRGPSPAFGFTSQYTVRVDDLFLQYLQRNSVTLELQLARGLDYQTVAACQLRLHQILEHSGKVFGSAPLVGVVGEVQSFGTLEYWLRLRLPMDQAIRLYKERTKALGYLSFNHREEGQQPSAVPPEASVDDGLNELHVTLHCCGGLRAREPHSQPSPYVVYKLFDFPDHDTSILPNSNSPQFDDHVAFPVPMTADLDRYLKGEALLLYVFDDKETDSHLYLGKARVPLISLAHDKCITGTFELTDPSGQPSGTVDVTLKWRGTYLPPPGASMTVEQAKFVAKETPEKLVEPEPKARGRPPVPPASTARTTDHRHTPAPAAQVPQPKPRQRTTIKEKVPSKKVSFMDNSASEGAVEESHLPPTGAHDTAQEGPSGLVPQQQAVREKEAEKAEQVTYEEEADEEEVSHFSEGQVASAGYSSSSQESDLSDHLPVLDQDGEDALATDLNESIQSDSDDCIVPGQTDKGRKQPSERIRIEIVSLSLRPDSRVTRDGNIVRLFVEYRLLDLPSEETPLSLPKPQAGQSIHYNYSNVIYVDVENNRPRRELLRSVLRGDSRQLESIKFTVVSDPPEEEQDLECEDVGVAFLRVPQILEQQQDLIDINLDIMDVLDSRVVLGSLKVTVEALQALKCIMGESPLTVQPLSPP